MLCFQVPTDKVITADGVNRMIEAVNGTLPGTLSIKTHMKQKEHYYRLIHPVPLLFRENFFC